MQRRHSFIRQAAEAIEKQQGTQDLTQSESFGQKPQKASSFPSLVDDNSSLGHRGEHGENFQETEQAAQKAKVEDVQHESDATSKERSDRFSDDDSDGSVYSSVCSDEKPSPALSPDRPSSNSPVLRHESLTVGHKSLQSQTSENFLTSYTPGIDDILERTEIESHIKQVLTPMSQLLPNDKLQEAEENAGYSENDLPDWLLGKTCLSPAVSCTKLSIRSPYQIEDEIRLAVDSAAARVQEEIDRHEQFKSELVSAAACSALPPSPNRRSAISKLFSKDKNNSEKRLLLDDKHNGDQGDTEVQPQADRVVADEAGYADLLLLMEVVIDEGRTETIEIHEGDNPDTLAVAFAQTHALQPDAQLKLRDLIIEQLNTLAVKDPDEVISPEQSVEDDWAIDTEFDQFVNGIAQLSPANPEINQINADVTMAPSIQSELQKHERENQREVNYNSLKAIYGQNSHQSSKTDLERRALSGGMFASQAVEYSPVTKRLSISSTTPRFTTTISNSRYSSTKKRTNPGVVPAYERLHALAESKVKWIQRAQKVKELEQARDEQQSHRVELMVAKSRELVANRTNGGYAHIGERLHEEALSDMAKKVQRHERRVVEREHQHDWMCPKCAYVNRYIDSSCQNVKAPARQQTKTYHGKSSCRRETASSVNSSFCRLEFHPEILCGQPKPERLFQPTLLTSSSSATKSASANKDSSCRMATLRRQRHEKEIADKFQQTCPFKPKINDVSEEIVREKLETAAEASKLYGKTQRPRDPHLNLYEHSFQARALRNEREKQYLKQFPFKPDIGVNALWVAPDKSQSDFVERLAVDKFHELERKRVALHEKYAQDRDPSTGKKLFKPETGRAPAFARNKQGLPIGEFLHSAYLEQQEYHRQLREEKQREIKNKSQQTFVSEVSRQTLERRKIDTCSRIFNALLPLSRQAAPITSDSEPPAELLNGDTPQDEAEDLVIPANVNLSALSPEISRVVAIVFEYANHGPISRDAFLSHMDRLVRKIPGLSYSQVIFLAEHLNMEKGDRDRQQLELDRDALERKELTFHPVIDKNSREIAVKHGRVPSSKVFQTLNQYYDHYLERKEQRCKQQQHEFKKSHPFHPTLVTKPKLREPAASAFYKKIRSGIGEDFEIRAPSSTSSNAFAPTSYLIAHASAPPPAPLETARVNIRPCVRPIVSEQSGLSTLEVAEEDHLDETRENMSKGSLYTQLLDGTELMSRVLAALDEKHTSTFPLTHPLTKSALVDDESSFLKTTLARYGHQKP